MRTVAHLRPVQVWGRAARFAKRSRPDLRPPPGLRIRTGTWTAPPSRAASLLGQDRLCLLNETGEVARAEDWQTGHALLWLYNLHYFDDLGSSAALSAPERRLALMARWLEENPPGFGVGWQPYPTALRIVNWIKAHLAGFPLPASAIGSLAVQARWLADHIETHLLGNHLLADAKALMFAGLLFEGPEADSWARLGQGILAQQLPEQILADGGHFERSPMYHAIILEDLLDLVNLARAYGRMDEPLFRALPERIGAMRTWLATMTHPDGRISFFNDAAFGIACEPGCLDSYGRALGLGAANPSAEPITRLEASGYLRLALDAAVLIIDAAPVGPDYLPGHAHADTLSFELSLGATRLVVNGGTSVYGIGPQRQLERATASHSTVQVDGENSSEVWAGFRVGRRARVRDLHVETQPDALCVSAAHDGYTWLPGQPIHRRAWRLSPNGLTIRDRIEGRTRDARALFHLGPCAAPIDVTGHSTSGDLSLPTRRVRWRTSAPAQIADDEWRPEFGRRQATWRLEVPLADGALATQFAW